MTHPGPAPESSSEPSASIPMGGIGTPRRWPARHATTNGVNWQKLWQSLVLWPNTLCCDVAATSCTPTRVSAAVYTDRLQASLLQHRVLKRHDGSHDSLKAFSACMCCAAPAAAPEGRLCRMRGPASSPSSRANEDGPAPGEPQQVGPVAKRDVVRKIRIGSGCSQRMFGASKCNPLLCPDRLRYESCLSVPRNWQQQPKAHHWRLRVQRRQPGRRARPGGAARLPACGGTLPPCPSPHRNLLKARTPPRHCR